MIEINIIEFRSNGCKTKHHEDCLHKWSGMGFQVVCSCPCHPKHLAHDFCRSSESGEVGLEAQNRQTQLKTTRSG